MEIRKLPPEYAEAYRCLMLQALHEFPAIFVESCEEDLYQTSSHVAAGIRDMQQAGNQLFGAFNDQDELIGAVGLQQERLPKWRHKGVICGMYVTQEYQGRGIGRKLLEAALTCARGMSGLEQLNLVVGEHNTGARRLYESFGFNAFGVEPRELKVGDQYYNGVHMWLKLA